MRRNKELEKIYVDNLRWIFAYFGEIRFTELLNKIKSDLNRPINHVLDEDLSFDSWIESYESSIENDKEENIQ
tara:strand:- start:212 stop:430 length:219 start_codon:yes stop_codon:yes gene_type:complete